MMRDVGGTTQASIIEDAKTALTEAFRSVNEVDGHPISLSPISGETIDVAQVLAVLAWESLNAQWMQEATEREVATLDRQGAGNLADLMQQTDGVRWKTVQETTARVAAMLGCAYSLSVCCDRMHDAVYAWKQHGDSAEKEV